MTETAQSRWNRRYADSNDEMPSPAYVLTEYSYLLPALSTSTSRDRIRSLDVACGLGANAWYLAETGFESHAWDLSSVAIDSLNSRATEAGLHIHTRVCNVVDAPPAALSYDVIVVTRFLERQLTDRLIRALRPGGLIFYQTFVVGNQGGPTNPDYLLETNELLSMFGSLTLRAFEDAGRCGRIDQGMRNESLIVVEKCKQ